MPKMNGQEFYRQAIQMKPELARRILFLTGDVVSEDTQAFLQSRATRTRQTVSTRACRAGRGAGVARLFGELVIAPGRLFCLRISC